MIPSNLLQLRGLDNSSSRFHEQPSDFPRGDVYHDALPNPQSENVEYLDSVSLHMIFTPASLKVGEGSRRYFRSFNPPISRIPA